MPSYSHQCQDKNCNYEWEDFYSIKKDPPKICPKCNQETAKRLIVLTGKGVVELTGNELVEKIKADANQIRSEASRDPHKYANLIGESDYQKIQTRMDNQNRYKRR